ncbi:MAG: YraN family protein [Deltaproteobacteria bacterium]
MTIDRLIRGFFGQDAAEKELKKQGYTIIERNFRCRHGEIDIIAEHGTYIVFIEVKTRSNRSFGTPACSIDSRKKRRIIMSARQYLSMRGISDRDARFDVASIELNRGATAIEIIKDAFNDEYGQ